MRVSKTSLLDGIFIIFLGLILIILSSFEKLDIIRNYPFITLLLAYNFGRFTSYIGKKWENKLSGKELKTDN